MTAPAPRLFASSGGDVLMRVENCAVRIDADMQADLLSLYDDERRAAARHPDGMQTAAWIAAMEKHNQLETARMEAGRWARASGGVR